MLSSNATTQSLESLMSNILRRRRLSRDTQRRLMALLLGKTELNSYEQAQVEKIFEAITQGQLRVID